MIIHTMSEGMSLAHKLEKDTAAFYEALLKKHSKDAEIFQGFVKENKKFEEQIDRAYYGVITDALEGGYALNLEIDGYTLKTDVPVKYADALKQALTIEEKTTDFYTKAAEQSNSLMADVPRNFGLIAKKRESRKAKLQELLAKA
jgi:rubrerythrin